MPTIVDSLIVTLGLDPKDFKKGTTEAERQTKLTQETLKKSSEQMTRSLMNVARQVGVLFLGFEGASGLLNFLARLNLAQASLGRMALNLGISARALDVWDKKIELAGGSVQAAQGAVNQLMADATSLQTTGAVSPLLVFFNKLGISAANTAYSGEQAKAAYDALFETLSKLPRAQAFQIATQAGISPEVLSFGLRPEGERAKLTAEAERLSHATDASTKAADELRERWVAIKSSIEAIGVEFLEKVTPAIERILPIVEKLAIQFADFIGGFDSPKPGDFLDGVDKKSDNIFEKLKGIRTEIGKILAGDFSDVVPAIKEQVKAGFNSPSEAWEKLKNDPVFVKPAENLLGKIGTWLRGGMLGLDMQAAEERHGLPVGMLHAIAVKESGMDPNAVSPRGAVGLMQLNPRSFPGAGRDPRRDIETAAAELQRLYGTYGNWATVLAAYNDGQKNLAKNLAMGTVPQETINYVPAVMDEMRRGRGAAAASTKTSNLSIGEVHIHTQATDGKAAAIDFMAEMNKRNLLLQSDTGIVP